MALNVTYPDSNGRIARVAGSNVIVPKENAGVGDLIYKSSGGDVKVIGRGTANAATITINSTSYTLWGCIYSFVNGMAMVVAPNGKEQASIQWATSSSPTLPSGMPTDNGSPKMRNGGSHTYVQMNTATNSNYIKDGSSAPVTLGSAYRATSLQDSTFASSASADIKAKYGSWNEYIRQTLRVQGAPGTPFGAVYAAGKVKVHEFGRWATHKLYAQSSTGFPAAKHCYEYTGALGTDAVGTWWLPSMFELAELMIDENLNKVNENSAVLSVSAGLLRWSSVLLSASAAWRYYNGGLSGYYGLTDSSSYLVARPVTLLKL